ncbi:MAG: LuxR family transcriptional regulator [Mesorhizobium sp.]|uniref:LuxR family transcriptional regulator n=1 Tax=unclassified Mesorhizobium TaxID=325217 RepID=UPI000F75858C|nr:MULTISPECIES: LuxR family transcriptional regulator [unclassified Mesorhizobium]AZO50328.1 LuxR family transcriptional regulator [Mesorhizobium sp. M4B.F.Ca.ET.058.02.1.1]RWD38315.1 MAG: LuxR family transcriptional regulator [Mesorhizobium sp.]TIW13220.1 MAG: LuxR family transcriptional regulator [Mesorhizobium sp.]TIW34976.1 MAG: LuxR family transcriptional regulator [Mesorhizobium sp.]
MQTVFERFLERLSESVDEADLRGALADVASGLDLRTFAYLSLPPRSDGKPTLISNYPAPWTAHYLENGYESIDPVIVRARSGGCPFRWGSDLSGEEAAGAQVFEEAAQFGICCGMTTPIIDRRGNFAAITFAADKPDTAFFRATERHVEGLPYIATCFHMFVRCKLSADRMIDGVLLTPREYECLQWAQKGKSDWEIGCILGITQRTAAFHLGNARRKLGVTNTKQAIGRLPR